MKMKKGFTLIELMVVIAIIAILAAVVIPTLMSIQVQGDSSSPEIIVEESQVVEKKPIKDVEDERNIYNSNSKKDIY